MASFKKAFKAARGAGKKVFSWNGKSYNTKLASDAVAKSVPTPTPRPRNTAKARVVTVADRARPSRNTRAGPKTGASRPKRKTGYVPSSGPARTKGGYSDVRPMPGKKAKRVGRR